MVFLTHVDGLLLLSPTLLVLERVDVSDDGSPDSDYFLFTCFETLLKFEVWLLNSLNALRNDREVEIFFLYQIAEKVLHNRDYAIVLLNALETIFVVLNDHAGVRWIALALDFVECIFEKLFILIHKVFCVFD